MQLIPREPGWRPSACCPGLDAGLQVLQQMEDVTLEGEKAAAHWLQEEMDLHQTLQ